MASLCSGLGVLWPTELPYRQVVFWTNFRKTARVPAAVMSDLPTGATKTDAEYMRACVKLAKKALGHTSPNPMVGCIIVKNGSIIGHGYHPKAGEPHAEVHALREAGDDANGATAYVSLEPCNHYGRTPPCSRALVQAKVKRVVIGIEDPNPLVAGKGIETLRNAGIEVIVGVEEELCRVTNEAFIHRMLTGTPFTCLRYRVSLDGGFIGSFETVETTPGSHLSQQLQEYDAVVVTDAAVYNDPLLVSSELGAKQPLRIVLARSLDLPIDAQVFDTSIAPTLVITTENALVSDMLSKRNGGQLTETMLLLKGVELNILRELKLDSVLGLCFERGFCSVLLDSQGPDMSGLDNFLWKQAFEEELVQRLSVIVTPILLGKERRGPEFLLDQRLIRLKGITSKQEGMYVIIEGYLST